MHYNLLHTYINVYRANSDNGDETNVYSDQVNGRHHRIFLPNNNFALRNYNKMRNNIFHVRCNNTIILLWFDVPAHVNCDVTRRRGDVYYITIYRIMYLYDHLINILLQSILPDLILWRSCRLRVLT